MGYEALLYDCMLGDATLFQRADTIEAAWRIVDPVLNLADDAKPAHYTAGTTGPGLDSDGWSWSSL